MISAEARYFLIALQFLTRVHIWRIEPFPEDWLARSAKYMPLVGALIGLVVGAFLLIASIFLPGPVAIGVGLVGGLLLTGALHEDGLADTVDAFGGGANRERRLEIMKDSRIGTYGTLALISVLALKGLSLAALDPVSIVRVLVAGYAGARLTAVLALAWLPYAGGDNAKSSRMSSRMTATELAVAIVTTLIAGFCTLDIGAFAIASIAAALAAGIMALIALRKIGGYTGDVLGAVEQVYETTFLVFAAALIAGPG